MPCAVASVLAESCTSCHGTPPRRGAKTSLSTREALLAHAPSDPSASLGELVVARMKDAQKPMPESGLLPADKVAIVSDWVAKGMPEGTCEELDARADPFWDQPEVCTNGPAPRIREGENMDPGMACNDCHTRERERTYPFAGTVYPTPHEPDRCYGTNGAVDGAKIVASDLAGNVLATVNVNRAGNFLARTRITVPYVVKVVQNGKERAMKGTLEPTARGGDCNLCHTTNGAEDAPGRIVVP